MHAGFADPFDGSQSATQTTLGSMSIGSIPGGGNPPTTSTYTYMITNGVAGVTFTDYHLTFTTSLPDGGGFVTVESASNSSPFTASVSGNTVNLTGANLAPGSTLPVSVTLEYNYSVDVTGMPSVPEPPSLMMCGMAGLMGLGYHLRRRLKASTA